MKKLIKPFLVILVFTLFVFIFSLVYAFWIEKIPADVILLEKDVLNYRLQSGFILFSKLLFSTFATGVATGFSWAFAKEADPKRHRSSAFMLPQLKNVLIVVTACTLLFIVAGNLLQPTAELKQNRMIQNAANFKDYTEIAKAHADKGEYVSAEFYAASAYALNPDDADAKQLADEMALRVVSMNDYVEAIAEQGNQEQKLQSALDYLFEAQKAWDRNDYWNAHYYAVLAEETSPRDDETLKTARELAASAWNMLGIYTEGVAAETEAIYFSKKAAYDYLEKGDILQAYYAFRALSEQYPQDLDIAKYFESAKSRLEASYFYTDETADTHALENFNNVSFVLTLDNGNKEAYEIKGITVVGNTGQLVQYLRDIKITKTDRYGRIISVLNVPYAKMTAQNKDVILTEEGKKQSRKVEYVPFLLLESVNRDADIERLHIVPTWRVSSGEPVPSYLILDMPYDDFTLIRQAAAGPDLMPLVSLFRFVSKADRYGFPASSYRTTLVLRLSLPLFVLAILLLMACIGWNFRLEADQPFKTRWLLMFPLLAFVTYIAKDLLMFILKLLVFVLCDSVPSLSVFIVICAALLCVLFVSIRFLSQRSE